MWPHLPWMLGLLLAPLLLGSVTAEGQAPVAILFASSLLWLAPQLAAGQVRWFSPAWRWALLGLLLLTILPLPLPLLSWISPERAALAKDFPLDGVFAWHTLSLSPAGTLTRFWELALIVTCFCLARQGAQLPGFPLVFARFVAAGVFLLAASDVWLQLDGKRHLLGLWENRWGTAAGTFANRNHFANWLYVGVLLLMGWLVRTLSPLQSARSEPLRQARRRWPTVLMLALVILPALVLAVACGSRAGSLAFGVGLLVLVALLARRSRSRRRTLVIGGLSLGLFVLMLAAGGLVLERAAGSTGDFAFKAQIAKQTLVMAAKFPVFGVGTGAFAPAFNHYKSMRGDLTFWHAENEWVQLAAELGLAGVLLVGGMAFFLCRGCLRCAWNGKVNEPELFYGALAGGAAFATHATFEFVFQIPATAILAAGLFGLAVGMVERGQLPALPPPIPAGRVLFNYAWALALLGLALAQGLAWRHWQQAQLASGLAEKLEHNRRALRYWPVAVERHVPLLRAHVQRLQSEPRADQFAIAAGIREGMLGGLRLDPFNWNLRLELAWFDLAFNKDQSQARQEAWRVVRLNPLQPKIPLRFARYFAAREPSTALAFLQEIADEDPGVLREVMEIAWQADHQPATLWSLTPDTADGLLTLADFALGRSLNGLAVQACLQLSNRVDGAVLAQRYLRAGQPALATNALARAENSEGARLLMAQAVLQSGQHLPALRLAEHIWRGSHLARSIENQFLDVDAVTPMAQGGMTIDSLREQHQARPDRLEVAHRLAEAVFALSAPQRDLALLRQLAQQYPREPRYLWMVVQTELERGNYPAAAQAAVQLAETVQRLR